MATATKSRKKPLAPCISRHAKVVTDKASYGSVSYYHDTGTYSIMVNDVLQEPMPDDVIAAILKQVVQDLRAYRKDMLYE